MLEVIGPQRTSFATAMITAESAVTNMQYMVGCVAQLAERRSLAGELILSCARPAADGKPLCG